jgi:TatD DNase family protein
MTYIDIHCHLDRLKDSNKVVEEAKKSNVKIIANSGVDLKSNIKAIELIEKYPEVKTFLGLHPLDIQNTTEKQIKDTINFIKKHSDKILGIGEIGIDLKEQTNFEQQQNIFEKMIELAKELDKPVLVHSRKAEMQCIEILEKHKMKKVIMHCYSGKKSTLKRIEDNGWFISIPASIKYNEQFQIFAKLMPIKNIFCETDSPFLHPERKIDNTPKNVVEAYKKIAEIKQLPIKEVEKVIEGNFERLFD